MTRRPRACADAEPAREARTPRDPGAARDADLMVDNDAAPASDPRLDTDAARGSHASGEVREAGRPRTGSEAVRARGLPACGDAFHARDPRTGGPPAHHVNADSGFEPVCSLGGRRDGAQVRGPGASHVVPPASRREALAWLGGALCVPCLLPGALDAPLAPDRLAGTRIELKERPVAETGSDVGSLYPFIHAQAVKGEPRLSFLRGEFRSVAAWKRKGRARLLDLLHYAPPKCDPGAVVVERIDHPGYTEERIEFNTTPDLRIPASVLLPKGAPTPAPALVALHDHGGFYLWGREKLIESKGVEHPVLSAFKKQYYGGQSIASDLARQGYVVIVIDMFYWGGRRMLLDDDAADWRDRPATLTAERIEAFNRRAGQSEDLVGRTIAAAGFTWPGVMLWDDMRTVDYLLTRPEVDPKRIGCVGLSVGGLRSCHLAALDDRIRAAVVVGWMTSFPAQLQRHVRYTIGATMLVPGLYQDLDYPDVAALAMPTPLLVINGGKDTLFDPAGVRTAFDKLAACYAKAGVPDHLRVRLYDTPHEFNTQMQAEAWQWLQRHLSA